MCKKINRIFKINQNFLKKDIKKKKKHTFLFIQFSFLNNSCHIKAESKVYSGILFTIKGVQRYLYQKSANRWKLKKI